MMNQYFVKIYWCGEQYTVFLSAKNPIHAMSLVNRDWYSFAKQATSIEIDEVKGYEVPE